MRNTGKNVMLPIENNVLTDGESLHLQTADELIPLLAARAFRRARDQALASSGRVMEACNGNLVETFADGTQRIVRPLPTPTPVAVGSKRERRRT